MPNDLDIIAQLEKRIGEKLPRLDGKKLQSFRRPAIGYQSDGNGRVIDLRLYECQLTEFPKEILKLQSLQVLVLSGDSFSSDNQLTQLPKGIGQLQNLHSLDLCVNQLTQLPKEIGQLQNLRELNLNSNQLTQLPKEIGQLQNLQKLYLDGNQLTQLPKEIGQLQNLQVLDSSHNQLTQLPKEIGQLQNLQTLDLGKKLFGGESGNRLTQLPKEIGQLQNLRELSLHSNQLTQLPKEIGQLQNLQKLSLHSNQLTQLPKEIGQLQNLQILDSSLNQLTQLPKEIGQLQNLRKLFLYCQQLTQLPKEIGQLQHLQHLYLDGNQLTQLPKEIGQLQNLQWLILSGNQLTQLPKEIIQLQNLQRLRLGRNQLTKSPKEIGQLQNLQELSLCDNQLTEFPKELFQLNLEVKWSNGEYTEGIYVENNPFQTPPVEIVKQGRQAIIDYYKALEKDSQLDRPLNELKLLLVGDGGAGKTSLLKRLLGHPFDPNESQTHGINLNTLDLPLPATSHLSGDTVKLHCWDFGGQEIMHATHQFFLSKRSLYMLVLDSRREAKTDYWLKHIQSFGDKSPVIIVVNKIDENPSFDLPRQPLQKYNIAHFCRLSCRTGEGLDALKQAIQQTLPQVELVQTVFPSHWWQVKTALEQFSTQGQDYLSYDHYLDLCRQHEVTNESEQHTLIDFLHDLGLVIHFDQKLLRETNIINPKWLTEAVYKLITAPQVIQQQGTLFTRQLKDLLDTRIYPSHKHDYLLELLKKFELGYAVGADQFLLPDVFPVQEPTFSFDYAHALHFVLDYDFFPKAVMSRFIVRMHQDIQDNLHWRTGVVIHDQKFDTTALIQATDSSKRLHIYVTGQQRRDYLAIILFVLRDIHHSFAKLTVKEKICLPDNPEVTVSYTHLLNLEKQGIATYTPDDSDTVYHVKDLLGTIHNPHANEAEMLSILRKLESVLGDKTEESVLQHVNDVVKINPNFFGIEVNVSELIKKLWKKRR